MARFGHSLPKEKLGGIGLPSWLPDWLTGKDVREIQGPVYIPPRGKAGGYRKELAADIARNAKDPFTQRDIQSAVIAGADVVPLVGEDVGVHEAAEDWQKGNKISAIAGGLGTVVGVVPIVGDVGGKLIKEGGKKLAKGLGEAAEHLPNVEKTASAVVDPVAPKGLGGPRIKAYHGSPHSFEEFDISKIGTGEGAQAYGHGLYFAENEAVARDYRNKLATGKIEDVKPDEEAIAAIKPKWDELTAELRTEFAKSNQRQTPRSEAIQNQLDALNANAVDDTLARKPWLTKGSMYEVDIAADPEAFLDWDKPLSEQSPRVQEQLGGLGSAQKNRPLAETDVGKDVYYKQTQGLTSADATERLKEAGIPGIRYLDQGSRWAGDPVAKIEADLARARQNLAESGNKDYWQAEIDAHERNLEQARKPQSRNYVVFDPKLISIVKKYGLAAAIASGLISEEMGRQMQEQGEL